MDLSKHSDPQHLNFCVTIVSQSQVFVSLFGNQRFGSEFALSVVTPWKGDYDA